MKRLYRSNSNRIFLGIFAGLGEYFKIDPTFLRILFIILCIFTGIIPLVLAYFIAALIIPMHRDVKAINKYKKLYRSKSNKKIAGICGGIGTFFNTDPVIIRLIALFLCFISGIIPLVLAYFIGWIIIPKNSFDHFEEIK